MSNAIPLSAGLSGAPGDPFARILALDDFDRRRLWLSLLISLAVYAGGLGAFAKAYGQGRLGRQLRVVQELEIPVEPPPPPPAPPDPPPEPEPEKAPAARAAPPPDTPPPAAQAGKVLTADPDPNEPVDLTGDGFVQGNAETFVGGVTASSGTSKTAVYDTAAVATAPPLPPKVAAAQVDRSRNATPVGGNWECGFPAEADLEQVNHARVSIAVTITPDGHATSVNVVNDPGFGFGGHAKRCALRQRYTPALGKDGSPITKTQLVTITFRR